MADDRWQRVADLYQSAQDRSPEERLAFVREASEADSGLRWEVESLLAQDIKTGAIGELIAAAARSLLADNAAVQPGSFIGPYRIDSLLGVGGMGEVYRARDSKLNRDVAIKILPPAFANDPDRLARFKREAQVLASLNHPNIATIHGFEDDNGVHALVLELVEGPTLAEHIAGVASGFSRTSPENRAKAGSHGGRRLPIEEAMTIARQIAEALEAAHEKGIIHRDLKPGNVKLTKDRAAKVLDFGLAKVLDNDPVSGNVSQSPTLSMHATQAGVILGTAAYMAPEQARGLAADHRSDVFSFGVVLYEMLTGCQPFSGETIPDVLASILARDPDLSALAVNLNPRLIELIRRCLDKNPRRRWQAIGDVRAELETIAASPVVAPSATSRAQPVSAWRIGALVAATALISAALATYVTRTGTPNEQASVVRLTVPLAPGQQFTTLGRRAIAISPDGQQIVYVAGQQLFLRRLSQAAPTPIKGTEVSSPLALNNPVFSPDGGSVAYFVTGMIRKIPVSGGTATAVCAAQNVVAMSWDSSGIIFTEGNAIKRVVPDGGEPQLLFSVSVATDAQMLPDGRTLLLAVATDPAGSRSRIVAQPLPTGQPRVLVEDGTAPRFLSSGHLIFVRGGVLLAARFDVQQLLLRSDPVPVLDGVRRGGNTGGGAAQFAVSNAGSLAYIGGPPAVSLSQRSLILVDMKGNRQLLNVQQLAYNFPRVSPDGNWLAVDVDDGNEASIYVYPLSGISQIRRLTLTGHNRFPVWSHDSRRITFQSDAGGAGLFSQRADGSEPPERLTTAAPGSSHIPESWSPDGKTLLFAVMREGVYELETYFADDKRSAPFADVTSLYPPGSTFSRDGRLVAYYQRDPGSRSGSLFVRPFPTGTRYEVVKGGGLHPIWLTGTEPYRLMYRLPTVSNVVDVRLQRDFDLSAPVELPLGVLFDPGPASSRNMDVVANRDQLVVVTPGPFPDEGSSASEQAVQVVINWLEEVKARLPERK